MHNNQQHCTTQLKTTCQSIQLPCPNSHTPSKMCIFYYMFWYKQTPQLVPHEMNTDTHKQAWVYRKFGLSQKKNMLLETNYFCRTMLRNKTYNLSMHLYTRNIYVSNDPSNTLLTNCYNLISVWCSLLGYRIPYRIETHWNEYFPKITGLQI